MNLEGKVVLITGGSMGLGASIAQRLVADGAKVCITARNQETLDRCAKSLPSGSVTTCAGDVTKQADCKRMVEATLAFGGKLDVLVNNAGIEQPPAPVAHLDLDTWQALIDINLTGPFFMMKESIPHMIKAGGGSIINVSSLAAFRSLPGTPAYCASKGGLVMLTKQVALDYGSFNIRCNAVCPGGVATEMVKVAMEDIMAKFPEKFGTDMEKMFGRVFKNIPLRRISVPHEMSGICSYLASDDSSYMTGSVLMIDGGAAVVDPNGSAISDLFQGAGA
jgi:meso-butanediol dehydrogenase / (S,S)-butanediol dehydrogenase / diacetyl reductase